SPGWFRVPARADDGGTEGCSDRAPRPRMVERGRRGSASELSVPDAGTCGRVRPSCAAPLSSAWTSRACGVLRLLRPFVLRGPQLGGAELVERSDRDIVPAGSSVAKSLPVADGQSQRETQK